ncbi:hypothetical protein NM208_g5439 [Fusarium decemcellulare]|uniref:Uncharacterized protein n=1 Tax=Fusarium decemcellulare TaxID=57161 RepID=A0ACC1SH23_9HYPO|nr:hypothetical protein NM208_g5439 [Fusarium decemcellulare]
MSKAHVPAGDVTASINFYLAPEDGAAPFDYVDVPPPGKPERNYGDIACEVLIQDVRGREDQFTLDHDGFQLFQGEPISNLSNLADEPAMQRYYKEMEQLLLSKIPGTHSVYIFDHTLRRADPAARRSPVQKAHIDQTAVSVEKRIRMYYPTTSDTLLKGRYRLVNVWRPLNRNPVQSFPLAFASSATLAEGDFIPVTHHHLDGYIGQTASIAYNPGQDWYYWSGMTNDECIFLECFDSESLRAGSGVYGRVPHSAFDDPRTDASNEPRESVEIRALVFGP